MNVVLNEQLNRVENALQALVDSISSYHPSIPAAEALLAADDELRHGLNQLHTHQRNEQRIQQLREIVDQHDTTIKSNLQLLVDTRADLLSVPSSLPPPERKNVDSANLLEFAKRISRFPMPSGLRVQTVVSKEAGDSGQKATGAEKEEIGLQALVDEEKQWLDPWTGVQMTPWPGEAVIRSSALARMQAGGDLGELYGAQNEANEEVDAEIEGSGALGFEGGEDRRLTEALKEHNMKKEEKPAVFGGLDLYDPDVDD